MRNYPQKIGAFCNRIKEWKQGMCQRDNNLTTIFNTAGTHVLIGEFDQAPNVHKNITDELN